MSNSVAVATGTVLTETQLSSISAALTTAIQNTLGMFIDLLPISALICGVAFGIRFIRGLFKQVKNGN